jgi:hypothetical protein
MSGALPLLRLATGGSLALAAWLVPRRVARARRSAPWVLLIDAAPVALGAGLLLLATGRPIFAGGVALALGAALALIDHTMRQTLREPVVFSEAVELPQVFTHPHLYLPFAGSGLVVGGAAMATALGLALLILEPATTVPHPLAAAATAALIAMAGRRAAHEPALSTVATLLRRLRPSGEPFDDAASLGPFAMLLAHTVIARAERGARWRALAAPSIVRKTGDGRPAIIIVQCESFFDARRLDPRVPAALLPGFDACVRASAMHGRFCVPAWGANTMRAEFGVLTGIAESELGYDRFNPYYALARRPIGSQVWRVRRAGYRTICLHPFDRRFFRRDLVMPALGFEEFRGRERLGGRRQPPYCPDPEFAVAILGVLDEAGPDPFIFAITIGNHGPWQAAGQPLDPAVASLFDPAELPDGAGLLRYLDGLRRSDTMLQILLDGLERRGRPATLAFYGDHLPSLSRAFAHFGFEESASDYAIWPGAGIPLRRDLLACELGRLVVDTALDEGDALALPASRGDPAQVPSAAGQRRRPAFFQARGFLFEVFRHTQARLPDRCVGGLFGKLAIPRCQLAQFLRIVHARCLLLQVAASNAVTLACDILSDHAATCERHQGRVAIIAKRPQAPVVAIAAEAPIASASTPIAKNPTSPDPMHTESTP